MLAFPANLEEFDRDVPDEPAAERLLTAIRWPTGVCCPDCGSRAVTRLTTRKLWQCRDCRYQPSVRARTVLHRTRTPLRVFLRAVWRSNQRGGCSTRRIASELEHRYATIFDLLHKVRACLADRGAWPLELSPVHVGAVELPAPKVANGDPEHRPPVVVAFVVEEEGAPPAAPGVRFEVAPVDEVGHTGLVERARELHVARTTQAVVERALLAHHPIRPRGPRVLEQELRCVKTWLRLTFKGVSRRYMPNYLAQYGYKVDRWHLMPRLFGYVLRRVMWEPWRRGSDKALPAP